ncbi:hypothetical protein [Candidatus Phytoplasma oryzae]|nr:hypothetical protein PIE28_01850 [Candidatus Phytoplasma oryzae]
MFNFNNIKIQINIYWFLINFLFLLFLKNNVFAARKIINTYGLYQQSSVIIDLTTLEEITNPENEGDILLVSLKADLTEELGIRTFEEFKQKCSFFYLNTFNMSSTIINNQNQNIETINVRNPRRNVISLDEHRPNEEILKRHIYPRTENVEEIDYSGNELTIISDVNIKNEESPPQNLILNFEIFADGYTEPDKKFLINVNINPEVKFILEISE